MDPTSLAATLALVGAVIVVATLLSSVIERTAFPTPVVFLISGAVLGPAAAGLLEVRLESPLLQTVSILSLALVLFTDALNLDLGEVRRNLGLGIRVLGPGTLLSAVLCSLIAWALLDLPIAAALVLGAALASTDPILLRGLVRHPAIAEAPRIALRLESSLNDVVLLPIVLSAMPFLMDARPHWGSLILGTFVLGPVAGVLVGLIGVTLLSIARRRFGVRRDYESIYSLGVTFAAFAAAEAVHGSGFLAAFAAGLTIVVRDVELCDCFLEYGETTAEMALLFTYVLFGSSLIWKGIEILDVRTAVFAVAVIAMRPLVLLPSLAGSALDGRSRWVIAWFGPRGLSSLLLIMLPVFAGMPGAERLFALCALVVLLSTAVHGVSLTLLRRRVRGAPAATAPAKPDRERISLGELQGARSAGQRIVIGDVRTTRSATQTDTQAAGAVRIDPDHAVADARAHDVPQDALIALYCA